jgi:hypothetical protein
MRKGYGFTSKTIILARTLFFFFFCIFRSR